MTSSPETTHLLALFISACAFTGLFLVEQTYLANFMGFQIVTPLLSSFSGLPVLSCIILLVTLTLLTFGWSHYDHRKIKRLFKLLTEELFIAAATPGESKDLKGTYQKQSSSDKPAEQPFREVYAMPSNQHLITSLCDSQQSTLTSPLQLPLILDVPTGECFPPTDNAFAQMQSKPDVTCQRNAFLKDYSQTPSIWNRSEGDGLLSLIESRGDITDVQEIRHQVSPILEAAEDFSKLIESSETLSVSRGSISEQLQLNELYVFSLPVNELIRYFSSHQNASQLRVFNDRLLSNITQLSASVAADLLRFPARVQDVDMRVIRALCERLLQFPPESRNLTSMQLALSAWSLAKARIPCTAENTSGKAYNSCSLMDSLAKESILKIREFQPLSIANMMWACGKMHYKNPQLIRQLASAGAAQLNFFNAQNIANTYWSLGALEFDKSSLTPRQGTQEELELSTILLGKFPVFNSQALANFVWSCAKLQWDNPRIIMAAAREASRCMTEFKPQEMANMMWGIAKLGLTEARPIVQLLAQHAAQHLHTFNSQEIANAYWAVGTLEIRATALTPPELNMIGANGLSTNSAQILTSNLSSDSLSLETRLAFQAPVNQTASTRVPSTMETLERCDESKKSAEAGLDDESRDPKNRLMMTILRKLTNFNAQAIANFFWACGKLQWKCPEICDASYDVVKRNVSYFRPQNTANFLWAMAKLKFKKEELINILTKHARKNLPEFNTQELANLYWALGTLEVKHSVLTPPPVICSKNNETRNKVYNSDIRKKFMADEIDDGTAVCELLVIRLKDFKPQEIANFLWACARLKWRDVTIVEEAVLVASRLLGRFKPQEIGNLVWSLAKLNYRHVGFLKVMCEDVGRKLNDFTSQNVANIYWALGSLNFTKTGLTPDNPSITFKNNLIILINQFNNQEIMNFLWACEKLRWNDSEILSATVNIICSRFNNFKHSEVTNLTCALKKLNCMDLIKSIELKTQ